jgi:acylpyruvate hydrolase
MKLATVTLPDEEVPLAGLVEGGLVHGLADGLTVLDVLAGAEPRRSGRSVPLRDVQLLAPHQPRAIFGVALNYVRHAQLDGGIDVPQEPMIFFKGPASAAAPGGRVRRPKAVHQLDYEAELALVMGKDGAVAGYTIANDVSARDIRDRQLARQKGGDGFCPFGPWITTCDEIPDPYSLNIRCTVNDTVRQDASTGEMVFRAEEIINAIQLTIALQPGDLILTGTPSGVGFATKSWLKPGDRVKIAIEGLGWIEHEIIDETEDPR